MRRVPFLVLTVAVLSRAVPAGAAGPGAPLTLDAAALMAFESREAVSLAENRLEQSLQEKSKALKAVFPDLSVSTVYAHTYADNPGSEVEKKDDYSYTFLLNQPIYTGGRASSALRSARRGITISSHALELTREEVYLLTAESYYGVLAAQQVDEAARLGVKQAGEFLDLANRRFELGELTRPSVLRAELALSQREMELLAAGNDLLNARERLETVIGAPAGELAAVPAAVDPLVDSDPDALVERALGRRRELFIADENIEIRREGVVSAKGKFLPLFYANGYYAKNGEELPPDEGENWGVSVNLDVPIYDRGFSASDLGLARLELERAELARSEIYKEIRLEIRQRLHLLQTLAASVRSLRKQVEVAEETARTVRRQYEVGLATDLEVTTALLDEKNARVQLATGEYDLLLAGLRLRKAAGELRLPE